MIVYMQWHPDLRSWPPSEARDYLCDSKHYDPGKKSIASFIFHHPPSPCFDESIYNPTGIWHWASFELKRAP